MAGSTSRCLRAPRCRHPSVNQSVARLPRAHRQQGLVVPGEQHAGLVHSHDAVPRLVVPARQGGSADCQWAGRWGNGKGPALPSVLDCLPLLTHSHNNGKKQWLTYGTWDYALSWMESTGKSEGGRRGVSGGRSEGGCVGARHDVNRSKETFCICMR